MSAEKDFPTGKMLIAIAIVVMMIFGLLSGNGARKGSDVQLVYDEALYGKVAKAAISKLMHVEPKIINVIPYKERGLFYVNYILKDDGKEWSCLCKFEGNKVVWAMANDLSAIGRWRTHPKDEAINYSIEKDSIVITVVYGDKSSDSKRFYMSEL